MKVNELFEAAGYRRLGGKRKLPYRSNVDYVLSKTGETVTVKSVKGESDSVRFYEDDREVIFLVALIDEEMVGKADLYFYPEDSVGQVEELEVMEEHRRKGIASLIYDHIETVLERNLEPSDELMTPDGTFFWSSRDLAKLRRVRRLS